jgi:MoaA/NifB/PqqE/SkfB family radical SAM enzyme
MELILKLRSTCNMNCTFCAASDLKVNEDKDIPQQIKDLLKVLSVDGLIITGGEPLMVSPEYLEELLELAGEQCTNISLTTNLKDFYLHPDKWTNFFRLPRVGICTSFNYGDTRKWDKNTIYDEKMFLDVMKLFKDRIGYTPPFISVIDESNEDTALDNVYLARELGCECKLNGASKAGRQMTHYPRYKMFQFYLKILELGLEDFESNTKDRSIGRCALNTSNLCYSCIRAAYVDIHGVLHYASCEDILNSLSSDLEIPVETSKPEVIPKPPLFKDMISNKCINCELCWLCNSCRTRREEAKDTPEHCKEMTKLKSQIIENGWKV